MGANSGWLTQSGDICSLYIWPKGLKNKTIIEHPTTYTNKNVTQIDEYTHKYISNTTCLESYSGIVDKNIKTSVLLYKEVTKLLDTLPTQDVQLVELGGQSLTLQLLDRCQASAFIPRYQGWSEYTLLVQIQIQLAKSNICFFQISIQIQLQISNSNKLPFLFKYNSSTLPFLKFLFFILLFPL